MTKLSLLYIFVICAYFQTPICAQSLSALQVVYVKGSRELKLSQRESTFSVRKVARDIFDEQIAKTELK